MKRASTIIACVACHESHVVCGTERPCKRCISRGMGDSCKDIAPKKRGRPKKDQTQQPIQQDSISPDSDCVLSVPLIDFSASPQITLFENCFDSTFADDLATILNRPSSDPYQIEHNVQQLCRINQAQTKTCSMMQNNTNNINSNNDNIISNSCDTTNNFNSTSFVCSSPSPCLSNSVSSSIFSPSSQYPTLPNSSVSISPSSSISLSPSSIPISSSSSPVSPLSPCSLPAPEPGPYCLSGTTKFTASYLEGVFSNISQRMGFDTIHSSISPYFSKLVNFYDPLISTYGNRLLDMCPQRLMFINQLINEMHIPIIVYGIFSVLNANSAVRELLRQSKSHLMNKNIFDFIHPEDIPCFVKNSVECLVDFKEMERIRVRMLMENDKYCQCVLTETIHKNQNGVPLFSSLAIMRVDDV